MNEQVLPPNVLMDFERVAKRNNLTVDLLWIQNHELSMLAWQVIKIFEINLRYFIDSKISNFTGNRAWLTDSGLIYKKHLERGPQRIDSYKLAGIGFLRTLFADRYHKKLWVPCFSPALPSWNGTRKLFYQNLTTLVRVRNRIAHHEIIYNYPLIELGDFAQQIMLDVNSEAAKNLEEMKIAEKIKEIKLGSGGGI